MSPMPTPDLNTARQRGYTLGPRAFSSSGYKLPAVLAYQLVDDPARVVKWTSDKRDAYKEANGLSKLDIVGVPCVYDFFTDRTGGYTVQTLIAGSALLYQSLPIKETLVVARDVATILEQLHDAGFIHRDIAARNILWDGNRVGIVDFSTMTAIGTPFSNWNYEMLESRPPQKRSLFAIATTDIDTYAVADMLLGQLAATVREGQRDSELHAAVKAALRPALEPQVRRRGIRTAAALRETIESLLRTIDSCE